MDDGQMPTLTPSPPTGVLNREVHGDMRISGAGFSDAELAVGREVERLTVVPGTSR